MPIFSTLLELPAHVIAETDKDSQVQIFKRNLLTLNIIYVRKGELTQKQSATGESSNLFLKMPSNVIWFHYHSLRMPLTQEKNGSKAYFCRRTYCSHYH